MLLSDPRLQCHRIQWEEGTGHGQEEQGSVKAPKHPALLSSPSGMSFSEDSQVGERVGDASAMTFTGEEEAASIA